MDRQTNNQAIPQVPSVIIKLFTKSSGENRVKIPQPSTGIVTITLLFNIGFFTK